MGNSSVEANLKDIKKNLPENVTLVAVSKFHPREAILEAYRAGQRDFGESRAQELAIKAPELPSDIRWHFIGHLQTNKVKYAVEHASIIQSVDSLKVLKEIAKEADKRGKTIDILLQVHVAAEETKTGFLPEELPMAAMEIFKFKSLRLRGIMGMATNTDDQERIRTDFRLIKKCFDELRAISDNPAFDTISMGMSDDHQLAIEEGSTMVRIGTDIFGMREY
ncbi:MAG: YggS family pyridoxal phosphate-dependent enzyme [Paramuribaculum sp.]|nr:YggS family pyridoxal phosphate-dependent enzyme [Paramuribaculum sp.]